MTAPDFTIQARVRRSLARRWIQSSGLDVGTTDGVVFVKGRLEIEPGHPIPFDRERLIRGIRSDLSAIPGVVDVVLEFHRDPGETER